MLLCLVPVTADGCRLDRGEVWSPWDSSQLSLLRLQQAQRVCVWAGGPASLHSQTHCCLEPGVRPRAEGVPLRPPNRTSDCTLHHTSGPLPAFPVLPTGLVAQPGTYARPTCGGLSRFSCSALRRQQAVPVPPGRCLSALASCSQSLPPAHWRSVEKGWVCDDAPCAWSPRISKLPCSPHAAFHYQPSAARFLLQPRRLPLPAAVGPVPPKMGLSRFGL